MKKLYFLRRRKRATHKTLFFKKTFEGVCFPLGLSIPTSVVLKSLKVGRYRAISCYNRQSLEGFMERRIRIVTGPAKTNLCWGQIRICWLTSKEVAHTWADLMKKFLSTVIFLLWNPALLLVLASRMMNFNQSESIFQIKVITLLQNFLKRLAHVCLVPEPDYEMKVCRKTCLDGLPSQKQAFLEVICFGA